MDRNLVKENETRAANQQTFRSNPRHSDLACLHGRCLTVLASGCLCSIALAVPGRRRSRRLYGATMSAVHHSIVPRLASVDVSCVAYPARLQQLRPDFQIGMDRCHWLSTALHRHLAHRSRLPDRMMPPPYIGNQLALVAPRRFPEAVFGRMTSRLERQRGGSALHHEQLLTASGPRRRLYLAGHLSMQNPRSSWIWNESDGGRR